MNPIVQTLWKLGYELDLANEAAIEKACESFADNTIKEIATAIANHINTHGIGGFVTSPLKDALIESIPELGSYANEEIVTLAGTVETALANKAKGQ